MTAVRLDFPIDIGVKGVPPTQYASVRNLTVADLERLQGADLDTLLGACTGLSPEQVARLTQNDRAAIVVARRSMNL